MPNYNDAQGVADLLSQFDFNIISEGPGDFSPSHRKYTCEFSKPGSGIEEVIAIRMGQRREEARSEDGRVTLKGEAQASRAASEKLAEGRDTGSPAREDPSIV